MLERADQDFPSLPRQSGQAVTLVLVVLAVAAGAFVASLASPLSSALEREKATHAALARARDALIGRAASDDTRPGSLPCPDMDDDGDAESPVKYGGVCPSYIGRFPWKTLSVPELRDGSGERLWYALSPAFRDHPSGGTLNSDTPGQLTVIGTAPASDVVAIVFAPGPPLGSQSRNDANRNDVVHYLEAENANGDAIYEARLVTDAFNDKLLPITRDALFSVVGARVAREAGAALNRYYGRTGVFPGANPYSDNSYRCDPTTHDGRIPLDIAAGCATPPTNFADWAPGELPAWFASNNWNHVVHYAVSSWCASTDAADISRCSSAGGLTVAGLATKARALVISAGPGLAAQVRPCASASNCLEDAENANGDTLFVPPVRSALNNDRLFVVSEAP